MITVISVRLWNATSTLLDPQARPLQVPSTGEARQRAYYQATAALYHDRHAAAEEGEHELALERLVMLTRSGVLISDNNNVGQGSTLARTLKKLMKKLVLWSAFGLQTYGKRNTFAHIQVMNTKGAGEANLLRSATHVAIVARRQAI